MLQLVFILFGTAAVFYAAFHIIIKLVMMWTGKNKQEAIKTLHNLCSNMPAYHIASDPQVYGMLWNVVRTIIGEQRFHDLENLSETHQTYMSGRLGELPYIAFILIYDNENEKARLENALKENLKQCLLVHGLPGLIWARWDVNPSVQLPVLIMQYAETDAENKIIMAWIKQNNKTILAKHHSVKDEELDLDE